MKAVIFDMDGVIIDTEPLHAIADNRILEDSGITTPEGYFERFAGWTNQAMWEEIGKEYNFKMSVEDIVKLQLPLKLDLLREGDYSPISGVIELMEKIKELDLPMAIASSSPVEFIEAVVEKLGIREYIKFWLSGEDVARSKPEPDIFLKVAAVLNVDPGECLVIEDSASGITAAKRAGMKCIGYRNLNSGNQDLSGADFIVGDLNEIDIRELI
jgi:HAD superfamily hydrolase (TIGR01509 family)